MNMSASQNEGCAARVIVGLFATFCALAAFIASGRTVGEILESVPPIPLIAAIGVVGTLYLLVRSLPGGGPPSSMPPPPG